MTTLNGVSGVNEPPNFRGIVEIGGKVFSVILPGFDGNRLFYTPFFDQVQQLCLCFFSSGCLVNSLEVGDELLAVFPGHIFQAMANMMDDTALNLSVWKDCVNGILETGQTVNAGDEDILDEFGYVPFSPSGAQLLFQFCAALHEQTSLIVTTNLPFSDWIQVLGDERLTSGLLDRLTLRSHILEFLGDSYRFRHGLERYQYSAVPTNSRQQPGKSARKEGEWTDNHNPIQPPV